VRAWEIGRGHREYANDQHEYSNGAAPVICVFGISAFEYSRWPRPVSQYLLVNTQTG